MNIYTSHISSPVGMLRITCDDHFIKEVVFADDDPVNEKQEHPLLKACEDQLLEYFAGKRKTFELPLGQEGTAFQARVWSLLCEIPFGKTVSYNDLAKKYGDVKAIRAVASANGRNNLAIIVPCHRVIGSNQTLVGYAGGLPRKKWLLEHEARHSGVLNLFQS